MPDLQALAAEAQALAAGTGPGAATAGAAADDHPHGPVDRSHHIEAKATNTEKERALYQARVKIHPKLVSGTFRKLKWVIMLITLGIYYGLPWLRWDRPGDAPDQAVLIDFTTRKFYFFFIEIWPQEVYYLTGLLMIASFALFLMTSLAGRVWCGYACPQTVWTDLFIHVERFIEGDRNERIRLDKQPMSAGKLARRTLKHLIWMIIALATGGAWVFYFVDAPSFFQELAALQAPGIAYASMGILTFTTYALGGLMREQVCTYMCPWPRIQSALFDEEMIQVTYRTDRGEPRMPFRKGQDWAKRGDCIDCNQCVAACPMGIDIRDGAQLECINCGLCIDACNAVMEKIGRPRGLIAYDNDLNIARRKAGLPAQYRFIRPRTVLYAALIAIVAFTMLAVLLRRPVLEVTVQRDRNPVFVRLSTGEIRNGYTFKILNKLHEERSYVLEVEDLKGARVQIVGEGDVENIKVGPDSLRELKLYVTVPAAHAPKGGGEIEFKVRDLGNGSVSEYDGVFVGPDH